MKLKKFLVILIIAILGIISVGCGNSNKSSNMVTENNDFGLSGLITITGSTSVEKIVNKMISEFTALYPDVSMQYTGSGSSAGIQDTIDKVNDIGASSRELKDEEKIDGLQTDIFAYDGIVVAVNVNCPINNITIDELQKIYSGQITNWSEIGGENKEICVISREEASGTRSAFEELINLNETNGLLRTATISQGNGPVQIAVAGNENAIGYLSLSEVDDSVKLLAINNIEPTIDNIKNGSYSLSRAFTFISFKDSATEVTKAFLDFAMSKEGQDCVENCSGIRVD